MPITTIGALFLARPPAVVAWQTYEDDSLSFHRLKKDVASQSARAHHWHIVAINAVVAQNLLLDYMYEALEQEHKGVSMLAIASEPEDLKKEPEPTATLPAPEGGGELGLGLCHGHGLDGPMGGVKLFDVEFTIRQGCAGAGGPREGAGAGDDRDGPRGGVKLFDVEFTFRQGGPTEKSAR
jgi:hypothetical protein